MNKEGLIWKVKHGSGPVLAAAIHDGHYVREEMLQLMAISEEDRLREEDPFTGEWTSIGNTGIIGLISRFEVDLNRQRDMAVYIKPEDAWGLQVWKTEPGSDLIEQSLREYDAFYKEAERIMSDIIDKHGFVVVLDLHSYNHRRDGSDGPAADPHENPEVNIGTGTIDMNRWAPLVERVIADLRNYNYRSRSLDVRENIKFKGGNFSRWIHKTFPDKACSISIEFKKFFMDEWTGEPDINQIAEINLALCSVIPGIQEELKKLGARW